MSPNSSILGPEPSVLWSRLSGRLSHFYGIFILIIDTCIRLAGGYANQCAAIGIVPPMAHGHKARRCDPSR